MKLSYSIFFLLLIENLCFFNEIECILNGHIVTSKELSRYRYLVGILAHAHGAAVNEVCGGAILDKLFILTAAHCFVPRGATSIPDHDRIIVMAHTLSNRVRGAENSIERGVDKIFVPNSYFTAEGGDDIAVIKLSKELQMKIDILKIQSVNLPSANYNTSGIVGALVAGFGAHATENGTIQPSDGKLRSLEIYVYPDESRDTKFVSGRSTPDKNGNATGFCKGDSGSPLVLEKEGLIRNSYLVIGIVKGNSGECDDTLKAGVYTRVSYHLKFIKEARKDPEVSNTEVAVKDVTEAKTCPA